MKLKYKLFLDALMFIAIWFVMSYTFTGNLLHEILGIALILFFLIHALINRKYYIMMAKQIFGGKTGGKSHPTEALKRGIL